MSSVQIFHLLEGARQARGVAVIIDVFRAFSLACYLFDMGVREIRPVGAVEEAFALRDRLPGSVLIGERGGVRCDGFDFGNSPSTVPPDRVAGKIVVHTTSAGTQGIVRAVHAEEILTGSLVNADAVAAYLRAKQPETVSLVCMGSGGVRPAPEDELCAEYIAGLLRGAPLPDFPARVADLRRHGGAHFFDPARQAVFPAADFGMCTDCGRFPFVLRAERDELGLVLRRIFVDPPSGGTKP